MNSGIIMEATEQMATLPYDMQEQVLKFIKELKLSPKRGVTGRNLLKYAGLISSDDLQVMSEVIRTDCGRIDINEW
ncbi:MAG: hypothetical protein GY795_15480 [Desulfobacterales bacterium]|nr:hypothetical protein [Desulfobacterales bacterium]